MTEITTADISQQKIERGLTWECPVCRRSYDDALPQEIARWERSLEENGFCAKDCQDSKVYTYASDFAEFLMARITGQRVQIDEQMFYYWLEIIPPVFMDKVINVGGQERRVSFGFAEGCEKITAFWVEEGKFYAQDTDIVNS